MMCILAASPFVMGNVFAFVGFMSAEEVSNLFFPN